MLLETTTELPRHRVCLLPPSLILGCARTVGEADDHQGAADGSAHLPSSGDASSERATESRRVVLRELVSLGEAAEHGLCSSESPQEHGLRSFCLGYGVGHGGCRAYTD